MPNNFEKIMKPLYLSFKVKKRMLRKCNWKQHPACCIGSIAQSEINFYSKNILKNGNSTF